jgi:hypothetical protein
MTEQRVETRIDSAPGIGEERAQGGSGLISRRTVLRGATATVPTILTLTSGAALARSSNLIGTIQQANGDVLCLDPRSTDGPTRRNPNVYDLGSPPYAEVTRIPQGNQYRAKDTLAAMTPTEVCRYRGSVEVNYGYGDWTERYRRAPGVMVSNAACASFGTRISITDI